MEKYDKFKNHHCLFIPYATVDGKVVGKSCIKCGKKVQIDHRKNKYL